MAPPLSSPPFRPPSSPSLRLCSPHLHTTQSLPSFHRLLATPCHHSHAFFIPIHNPLSQESAVYFEGSSSSSYAKSSPTSSLLCNRRPSRINGIGFWGERAVHSGSGAEGSRISAVAGRFSAEALKDSFWTSISTPVATAIADLTPLKTVKWTTFAAVALMFIRWMCNAFLLNPKAWMFGSWLLVLWPWPAAVLVASLALSATFKHYKGKATNLEQFGILTGSLVWLILVPLAHVHGFVDGWPLTLFFLYMYFFLINPIIRVSLYDELSPPPDYKEWDTKAPFSEQIAFAVALAVGHVCAALEAPPLVYSWNWQWQSILAVLVLLLAFVVHWNATYFLGKYSFKLAKPRAVVMFGPYRFIRHPIYSSFMLLFAGYCLSLRSYWSLAFLMVVSLIYYERRTQTEEELLETNFGDLYTSYKERVVRKYFSWLY